MTVLLALTALSAAIWCALAIHASKYRKHGGNKRISFLDGLDLPELLSAASYTAHGQRLVPFLWLSLISVMVTGFLLLRFLAKQAGL